MVSVKKTLPKAIEMFESAVKLFWGGEIEKALGALERAKKESRDNLPLNERLDTLIRACRERLEGGDLKPTSPEEHYVAGVILLNLNQSKGSIRHLSRAVKSNGGNDAWLYTLACAYVMAGMEKEAVECLDKAIAINPQNKVYARNSEDFKRLARRGVF